MIDKVLEQIISTDLQPLAQIFTRMGGLVRVQVEKGTNGATERRYPVVPKLLGDCQGGDYTDMSPNSSQNGILYFQLITKPVTNEVANNLFREDYSLRCVGWFNADKVSGSASSLAANVAALIKRRQPAFGTYLTNISTKFTGFDLKSTEIFSAFTYNEAQSQYLMKPYDFFSFTLEIGYIFAPSCVPTITTVENECS